MSFFTADWGYRARDFYWDSPFLQYAYSSAALAWGRAAETAGQLDAALDAYCNAARRIKDPGLKLRRMREFARFVTGEVTFPAPEHLSDNIFVQRLLRSKGEALRDVIRTIPAPERASLKKNIIVLKVPTAQERGVLLLKYTPHFQTFLANFDLKRVGEKFSLVLEPSWFPYPEPFWAQFICRSTPVICQTISETPAAHMRACNLGIVPVPLGAQDWVNPEVFFPIPGTNKDFDVVMIASFMKLKRHYVLFNAMRKIRPQRIKVALIGMTWGRNRRQFEEEVHAAGIGDDVTIFQGLKGSEINEVLNRSKVHVLLSKMEGGNVALMEAMAAGVPCVVYKHTIGPRLTDINQETGMLSDDEELSDVLMEAIEEHARFRPREWFLRHTGPVNSTRILNSVLREAAQQRGESYSTSIVPKYNRLGLQYMNKEDEVRTEGGWRELESALSLL